MLQIFLFPLSFVRRTDVCASDRRTKFAFGRHSSVLLLPSDRARRDGGGDVSMNFANYLAISPTFCSNFSFYNKVFYYGKSQFTKTCFNKSNFVPLLTGKGISPSPSFSSSFPPRPFLRYSSSSLLYCMSQKGDLSSTSRSFPEKIQNLWEKQLLKAAKGLL